ncbi:hypothetical protein DH2020_011245 [Rehmannia glutinosa]|uniref:C2H2-type domain-containing protein n=1 Tax=Rehmannia glutinosa TaxID=99300 RepID=A0ABR0XCW2_REHGL
MLTLPLFFLKFHQASWNFIKLQNSEATLKALKEKPKEPEVVEPEPEPTTEVLFLCSYEGCGKTFIDVGALRKHSHIHGERQYVCHYENCGKAFSLDFNLKSHMKTHSQENYHVCPYPECGKRYAHEYKLKNHIASHHEKNENDMDEGSDMDAYAGKRSNAKIQKRNKPKPNLKLPPSKVPQRKSSIAPAGNLNVVKKPWPSKEEIYDDEDSEETEEERDNVGEGWRYGENNDDEDDEETEYED